jgi:hypothetical protein
MSFRSFALAATLVVGIAAAVVLAQPQVTVVLTNGQAYEGTLVYRNNTVGLMTSNGVRRWPANNVALIEFTPGQPDPNELSNVNTGITGFLSGARNVLVLNDGQVIAGNGVTISPDGNQVSINTSNGRDNYTAGDIARLYLNPSAAQNALAMNQQASGAVGTTGTIGPNGVLGQSGTITVPANQHWTPTGIAVRQGDRLAFRASGQIRWTAQATDVVGPQGGRAISPNYPVPTAGVGALIGKVGNSQPFLLPTNGETVTMPADGELELGINDDQVSDNSGSFQVQIGRVAGH